MLTYNTNSKTGPVWGGRAAYYGRILKKVTEDDVMDEMEKLPPAR